MRTLEDYKKDIKVSEKQNKLKHTIFITLSTIMFFCISLWGAYLISSTNITTPPYSINSTTITYNLNGQNYYITNQSGLTNGCADEVYTYNNANRTIVNNTDALNIIGKFEAQSQDNVQICAELKNNT